MAAEYDEMPIEELEKLLNERQRRFVAELETDGIAYKAAERAGYSAKTAASQASELLKNPKVAAYRRARARVLFEALGYDKPQLAMKLCEILDRCMAGKPHLSWDSASHAWVEDGTWTFDARGAVKAVEAIAKLQGLYRDEVRLTGAAGEIRIEFAGESGDYAD